MRKQLLSTLILLSCTALGCASKPPILQPPLQYERQGFVTAFTSEDWQIVLDKAVTPGGYVRWNVLQQDPKVCDALMRYVSLIGRVSPDNRPDLFQIKADQLAYWINAYNAVCIYGVLLRNLSNPPAVYATDHFLIGNNPLTLDQVEQQKIKPLNDPRAAFAVNHCTHSSPPLRKEPYSGLTLGSQLVDQGRIFLNDSRGAVRVDDNVVKISNLLVIDYAPQFLGAYQAKFGKPGTILQAIQPYAAKHSVLAGATKAVPLGYDGSLNRP